MEFIIGSEGLGASCFKQQIEYYIKLVHPDAKIVYVNNNSCTAVVRTHFYASEKPWNRHKKNYIYWNGEPIKDVKRSRHHAKSITISTRTDTPNSIYLPFVLSRPSLIVPGKIRKFKNLDRKFFVAYCSKNRMKQREFMFNLLVKKSGKGKKCLALGRCCGDYPQLKRKAKGGWWDNSLIKAYSNFYFVFAMENSKHPGYVTEKILNAFMSGAVPIFWGDKIIKEFFNPDAFIDVSDFKNFTEAANYICSLSKEKVKWMMQQPILNENNDIININKPNNQYHLDIANKIIEMLSG